MLTRRDTPSIRPCPPGGGRDLIASFHAVDEILARHEPGPATVVDDRWVEGLLRATSRTLHIGVANYCWFTDPGKALRIQLAGTPEADQPLIGMCDSARCRRPPTTPNTGRRGPHTPRTPRP